PSFFLGEEMAAPPPPRLRTGPVVGASVRLVPGVILVNLPATVPVLAHIDLPAGAAAAEVAAGTVRLLVDGEQVGVEDVVVRVRRSEERRVGKEGRCRGVAGD